MKTAEEKEVERLEARRLKLRRRERFGRGVANLFDIPEDVILDVPRIMIVGSIQAIIENHRGLIEYSPEIIRVGTSTGQVVIKGQDLAVGSVFTEDLSVMGRFSSIEFEEALEERE